MIKLLFILFFLLSCDIKETLSNAVNYDHCDDYSQSEEYCLQIELTCNDNNGNYTQIIADNPEDNDICCCEYDD